MPVLVSLQYVMPPDAPLVQLATPRKLKWGHVALNVVGIDLVQFVWS